MSFRASNALPAQKYLEAKTIALQLRRQAQLRVTQFSAGATSAEVLAALDNLKSFRSNLAAVRNNPGIAAYAKLQEDDDTYDVVAEFSAVLAAVDAALTLLVASIPTGAGGFLAIETLDGQGNRVPRTFTATQLSTLTASMQAIADSVS